MADVLEINLDSGKFYLYRCKGGVGIHYSNGVIRFNSLLTDSLSILMYDLEDFDYFIKLFKG